MTTIETPTLWESATVVPNRRPTAAEAFADFCAQNGWFLPRLRDMAYAERQEGNVRGSMRRQFEQLRGEIDDQGREYRLNNDWAPMAARKVMERWPDLAGFYELRGKK